MGKMDGIYTSRTMLKYAKVLEQMADICERLNECYSSPNAVAHVLANQLREQAYVLCKNVQSTFVENSIDQSTWNRIIKKIENSGILTADGEQLQSDGNRLQLRLKLKNKGDTDITTGDIAVLLSDVLHIRMGAADNCRMVLNSNWNEYTFLENNRFQIICGVAKKSQDDSQISGDNYYSEDLGNGKYLLGLADGMGTGREAWEKSRLVLDLLRNAIKVGFCVKNAIELVNIIFAVNDQNGIPVTLDLCVIDVEQGIADFIKLGAVATFVRRTEWIEMIQSETMPMGVLEQVDYDHTVKKLYAQDYIIMITDGVLDSIDVPDKEKEFISMIEGIKSNNPQSIAEQLLTKIAKGSIKDDMTILVAGMYE